MVTQTNMHTTHKHKVTYLSLRIYLPGRTMVKTASEVDFEHTLFDDLWPYRQNEPLRQDRFLPSKETDFSKSKDHIPLKKLN